MLRSLSLFLLLFCLLSPKLLQSQEQERPKVKLLLGFDNRRSFIEQSVHRVQGIRIGLQLKNQKSRIGLGLYNMSNELFRTNEFVKEFEEPLDTLWLDYGFLSIFYEHVWLHRRKYEISTPFQLGAGSVDRKFREPGEDFQLLTQTGIVILETSIASHYKLKPWVGIGAGFGYNLVLSGQPEVSRAFNSAFFVIKIKLFLGDLYRGVFKKKEGNY